MAPVQFYNGKPLFVDGKVAMSADCCCDEEPVVPTSCEELLAGTAVDVTIAKMGPCVGECWYVGRNGLFDVSRKDTAKNLNGTYRLTGNNGGNACGLSTGGGVDCLMSGIFQVEAGDPQKYESNYYESLNDRTCPEPVDCQDTGPFTMEVAAVFTEDGGVLKVKGVVICNFDYDNNPQRTCYGKRKGGFNWDTITAGFADPVPFGSEMPNLEPCPESGNPAPGTARVDFVP